MTNRLPIGTLKAVCFATILRLGLVARADDAEQDAASLNLAGLGLGDGLEHLSLDLKKEIDDYRREQRHAYLGEHDDNKFTVQLRLKNVPSIGLLCNRLREEQRRRGLLEAGGSLPSEK